MIGVTLKGLAGRKLRAFLTALAVVIGVAMVSGAYVLTDTIQKAFDSIFAESYDGHGRRRQRQADRRLLVQRARDRFLPTCSTRSGLCPSVEAAAGEIFDLEVQLERGEARRRERQDDRGRRRGADLRRRARLERAPLQRRSSSPTGKWAKGDGQVVIDANTADKYGYGVGDTIGIAALGPVKQYEITGVATFGSVDSIGGATIAVFDLPTAQALFQKEGRFDSISVAAKEGVSPDELVQPARSRSCRPRRRSRRASPGRSRRRRTRPRSSAPSRTSCSASAGSRSSSARSSSSTRSRSRSRSARVSSPPCERSAARAARCSARSSSKGSSSASSPRSSGSFLGLGLGKGMNSLFVAFGIDLPQAGTVFATRTIVVSLLVGTIVTVLASIVPALRATRVPPIPAVREGSTLPASRLRPARPTSRSRRSSWRSRRSASGSSSTASERGACSLLLGLGVIALFVGVALTRLAARQAARRSGRLAGRTARRLGGRLARENAVRNPGRTAATAAALMIGLALVTVVAVLGRSHDLVRETASRSRSTPTTSSPHDNGFDPLPGGRGRHARRRGGRGARLERSRRPGARARRGAGRRTGVDPTTIARLRLRMDAGSDCGSRPLGGDGAIAPRTSRRTVVSGRRALPAHDRARQTARVSSCGASTIRRPRPCRPGQPSPSNAFDASFVRPRNLFTFVNVRGDDTDARRPRSSERSLASRMPRSRRKAPTSQAGRASSRPSSTSSTGCSPSPSS